MEKSIAYLKEQENCIEFLENNGLSCDFDSLIKKDYDGGYDVFDNLKKVIGREFTVTDYYDMLRDDIQKLKSSKRSSHYVSWFLKQKYGIYDNYMITVYGNQDTFDSLIQDLNNSSDTNDNFKEVYILEDEFIPQEYKSKSDYVWQYYRKDYEGTQMQIIRASDASFISIVIHSWNATDVVLDFCDYLIKKDSAVNFVKIGMTN